MSAHPLRTARCLRNLTIKQLADEAMVGASTVWRAEHNYPINAESRRRLCIYFHMTSQELGLVNIDPASASEEPEETMQVLAPDKQREIVSPPAAHHFLSFDETASYDNEGGSALPFEQRIGVWLAQKGGGLASLFDAGLTLDEVLESLRVVLYGSQGMPAPLRNLLLPVNALTVPLRKRVSWEERTRLLTALDKSVGEGWQLFHTARPVQVLVTAQAQIYLVDQVHELLDPQDCQCLYAGLYNLMSAALYFQGHYDSAQQTSRKAYRAAIDGADNWDGAQSLNWQAIASNARGLYMDAIRAIESALRLVEKEESERFVRLRAHLQADRAYNASMLQEHMLVRESLDASMRLLEPLGSVEEEEFDLARWYQIAGSCMLTLGDYKTAIDYLERSLQQVPTRWAARRLLTLLPLAEAYARRRERDASLRVAEQITTSIDSVDSTMLNQRYLEYQHTLVESFPHDKRVLSFITNGLILSR